MNTAHEGLRWFSRPALDEVPVAHARAAGTLRVLLGLLWLYNIAWKRAPDFGQDAGNGLFKFTSEAVKHPVLPPFSWVIEHAVLPNFAVFGWLVLASETALAVMLLTGTAVRAAAALGIVQSLAIGLSVAYAPGEWPWSYWLMIGAHLVVLFSSAGRVFAVEALQAGLSRRHLLAHVWGGLSVLVGLVVIFGSLSDPLATRGFQVGSSAPSMSLGSYNLLGAVVLLVVGGLVLAATRAPSATGRTLALAASGLAVLGALSLYVQLGFSDPVLGGSATSAGYLLCLAVVGVAVSRQLTAPTSSTTSTASTASTRR